MELLKSFTKRVRHHKGVSFRVNGSKCLELRDVLKCLLEENGRGKGKFRIFRIYCKAGVLRLKVLFRGENKITLGFWSV